MYDIQAVANRDLVEPNHASEATDDLPPLVTMAIGRDRIQSRDHELSQALPL